MAMENIERRILESAQAEAEHLLAEARRQADEQLAQARTEQAERASQAIADAEDQAQRRLEQQATAKRNENRLALLAERSALLNEAFEAAVERFIGDRSGAYHQWLVAQVQAAAKVQGSILAAEADRDAIRKLLKDSQAKGLSVADETAPLRGGFEVKGEKIDLNLSLDVQLAEIRAKLLPELARRALDHKTAEPS